MARVSLPRKRRKQTPQYEHVLGRFAVRGVGAPGVLANGIKRDTPATANCWGIRRASELGESLLDRVHDLAHVGRQRDRRVSEATRHTLDGSLVVLDLELGELEARGR